MTTVSWGLVVLALILTAGAAGTAVALVHRVLAAPEGAIRVRIRVKIAPWPQAEIDVER